MKVEAANKRPGVIQRTTRKVLKITGYAMLAMFSVVILWLSYSFHERTRLNRNEILAQTVPTGDYIKVYFSHAYSLTIWKNNHYQYVGMYSDVLDPGPREGKFQSDVFGSLLNELRRWKFSQLPPCLGTIYSDGGTSTLSVRFGAMAHSTSLDCRWERTADSKVISRFSHVVRALILETGVERRYLRRVCRTPTGLAYIGDWSTTWQYRKYTGDWFLKWCD
ncbi:MAG TPA: hypothetical protein VJ998_05465 [Pseudomonadales bacterium]|nr:hypothetical protein [Pseudomonadales bacterium]